MTARTLNAHGVALGREAFERQHSNNSMNKNQLAEMLNGRPMGDELDSQEEKQAKAAGLVVVFGYSDDNAEFRGAINDEIGAGESKAIFLNQNGHVPIPDRDEREVLERFGVMDAFNAKARYSIVTHWDKDGYSWTYETTIPHATFDIMEDGEKFCRGIVFSIDDLPQ